MLVACFAEKSVIKSWLSAHKDHPQSSLFVLRKFFSSLHCDVFLSSDRPLLSLLQTNESSVSGVPSTKELRTIVQQLRALSNGIVESKKGDGKGHNEFLRVYATNVIIRSISNRLGVHCLFVQDDVVVSKRRTSSGWSIGSVFKLLVLLIVSFAIYSNWLWLTVAVEYLLEGNLWILLRHEYAASLIDYLKHPTAVIIRQSLSDACKEAKKYAELSAK